jgi:glycosyltransferase involved in cell wall biosynthesis
MSAVEISIVLPCLNEAETIASCIAKAQHSFARLGINGEILVIDNGSTDNSIEIAKNLNARVIQVIEKGYGSALLEGFKFAYGEYIIMADADDSYALDQIDQFVSELRGGSDLVMGNRFAGMIEKGSMPFLHKYIGNPVLSFIGRLLFKSKVRDFHCGIRGINRKRILLLDLNTKGMEFASELVVKSELANYTITEVPTILKPDGRSRPPHLRTWRDGWRHLKFLFSYSPKWLFLYPGILFSVSGFFGVAILFFGSFTIFDVNFDLQSLILSCFILISGTQMIWFAVLAKANSISKGFLPFDKKWKKTFGILKNDSFYLLYLLAILIGLIIITLQFITWANYSFGNLVVTEVLRTSVLGCLFLFVGFQALTSHFLLSMITMGTIISSGDENT